MPGSVWQWIVWGKNNYTGNVYGLKGENEAEVIILKSNRKEGESGEAYWMNILKLI